MTKFYGPELVPKTMPRAKYRTVSVLGLVERTVSQRVYYDFDQKSWRKTDHEANRRVDILCWTPLPKWPRYD